MAQLGELANVKGYKPGPAVTAAAGVRGANLGTMNLVATMQGQQTLAEHLYTVAYILPPIIQTLVWYFGNLLAAQAKINAFPNIETRATYDSIQTSDLMPLPGGAAIDVFVTTPYSKFQEFGFVHYQTGQWIYNPFMMPAADLVGPAFIDAVSQAANIAGSLRFFSGAAAASPANDILGSVRAGLYSYSKFAGDIQALGFTGLSKSRGFAIRGAAGLGDIEAIGAGTISGRALRRVTGRFGGGATRLSGAGFGAPRGMLSGPSARIYNRVSGRIFGRGLSGFGTGF